MTEDKIVLKDMEFYGYHGVLPEERALGQPFKVCVHIILPLAAAGREDNLEETIDYGEVYEKVKRIMTGKPVRLLETLAEQVAEAVLAYDKAVAVEVTVAKTKPPLPGTMGGVMICIRRVKR